MGLRSSRRAAALTAAGLLAVGVAACGSTDILHRDTDSNSGSGLSAPSGSAPATGSGSGAASASDPSSSSTPAQLGFPYLATKNTTRVAGSDPVSNAAAVALAVYPSEAAGTHPTAVALAPDGSWQAAVAAASLMGAPFHAPLLLSGADSLPTATSTALDLLAPTGASSLANAQIVRVGDVPRVAGLKSASIAGSDPATVAANIADYEATQRGGQSHDVVIASSDDPADAMVAAGYIAESGEPLLYVSSSGVPGATVAQLKLHSHPRIFVLGSTSAIPDSVTSQLSRYGTVNRITAANPAAESVAFAEYRYPACPASGACAHVPGSFGWAIRSPGHGFTLLNQNTPLDAAASAALSASGSYGPQLVLSTATTLPGSVLNYFYGYATPGYTSEGPTAAVYNHAWLIGGENQVSEAVQAQVDSILEPRQVPQG